MNNSNKSLLALAAGTLGFGITEYVMMGILPDIATDFHISIPIAGHLISAYALGVCVGAPLAVFASRGKPLRSIALALIVIQLFGSLLTTVSPNYIITLTARFISGLPHGAFFGVGTIICDRLSEKGKKTSAVAIMVMGMTIANLIGVPIGTMLSGIISWRVIFGFAFVWSAITLYSIIRWIPVLPSLSDNGLKGQFRFLKKSNPWMIIIITMMGNCGIFSWYSYISPLMTDVAGFLPTEMPWLMVLSGGSMCIGNMFGGRLSDRFTPGKVIMCTLALMLSALIITFFFAQIAWLAVIMMCICNGGLFAVSSPQQYLILKNSPGGEMMGGAMIQLAFNFGNAVGAYCGGIPIDKGLGVRYSAIVGAAFVAIGFLYAAKFVINDIEDRTYQLSK